jgi:hypothetical protein
MPRRSFSGGSMLASTYTCFYLRDRFQRSVFLNQQRNGVKPMTNETFNGYETYNHWQTALWLNNDEQFYNLLKNKVELVVYMVCTKSQAVYEILRELPEKTPDGAEWEADTILDLVNEHYDEQLQYS